jgi:small subunit ribosomal protein S21
VVSLRQSPGRISGYAAGMKNPFDGPAFSGFMQKPAALEINLDFPILSDSPERETATGSCDSKAHFRRQNEACRHMIKVKSRGNETAEQMLRRFKKLCEKEGLIKDMKRVSYYEKPSEKRRRRMRKSQTRQLKTGFEM